MKDDNMNSGCTGAIPVCAMVIEVEESWTSVDITRNRSMRRERQKLEQSFLSSDINSFPL